MVYNTQSIRTYKEHAWHNSTYDFWYVSGSCAWLLVCCHSIVCSAFGVSFFLFLLSIVLGYLICCSEQVCVQLFPSFFFCAPSCFHVSFFPTRYLGPVFSTFLRYSNQRQRQTINQYYRSLKDWLFPNKSKYVDVVLIRNKNLFFLKY